VTAFSDFIDREARMLEHAIQSDDATMRFVALVLTVATVALKLMTELVRAQASGRPAKVIRVKRRLDKVLVAAKARVLVTGEARSTVARRLSKSDP
jgi:hypothetical protein